jgi:anti-sigma regulatory factor (Ser/Thr protein kinase)
VTVRVARDVLRTGGKYLRRTMSEPLEVELPRDRGASHMARQLVAERFGPQLTAEELDTVRLLMSELVNNAVLHGQGQITMKAQADSRQIRVDVIDGGTGFERHVRHTGFDSLGGRGLQMSRRSRAGGE